MYNNRDAFRELVASLARVIFISLIGLVVGASVLSGVLFGAKGFISGPLFALFGWFYLIPILVYVSLLWTMFTPTWPTMIRVIYIAVAAIVAGLMMMAIGIRGPENLWYWGYLAGGSVAGCVCSGMVAYMKTERPAQRDHQTKNATNEPSPLSTTQERVNVKENGNPYKSPQGQ